MNQPPGGSVEADVETLRQTLEWDSEERRHMDGDPFQALANLTDHIGELEHERDMANAYADEQWQDEQRSVAMNEAQARIHYLEGRVGELEREVEIHKTGWMNAEADISARDAALVLADAVVGGIATDNGQDVWFVGDHMALRIWDYQHSRAALAPPMKGPNDDG